MMNKFLINVVAKELASPKPMIRTPLIEKKYREAKICATRGDKFTHENYKVRHHDPITGVISCIIAVT